MSLPLFWKTLISCFWRRRSHMCFTDLHAFGPALLNDALQILQLFRTGIKIVIHVSGSKFGSPWESILLACVRMGCSWWDWYDVHGRPDEVVFLIISSPSWQLMEFIHCCICAFRLLTSFMDRGQWSPREERRKEQVRKSSFCWSRKHPSLGTYLFPFRSLKKDDVSFNICPV